MDPAQELIRAIFSNTQGDKLMDLWQVRYGDQLSYSPGQTPEETAFREGQRDFYLMIKTLLEDKHDE